MANLKSLLQDIPQKNTIKYLGLLIDEGGNFMEHAKIRKKKATNALYCVRKIKLEPETFVNVFNTAILPVMLYGLEGWYDSKKRLYSQKNLRKREILL